MGEKAHWEKVYSGGELTGMSWYQPIPALSLEFIHQLGIAKDAAILDVGGGDSFLADHLLDRGYTNITVLDISETAIKKAKKRLGEKAGLVNWVVSDITNFVSDRPFECWHDRATFHFLIGDEEIINYLSCATKSLSANGKMILGTFSETGPDRCSGLPVKKYSEEALALQLKYWFEKITCVREEHKTPSGTSQDFIFCRFKKM